MSSYPLKIGEANAIPKGTVIFEEKDPITCICAVIKGSVTVQNEYLKLDLPTGTFLGMPDSISRRYLLNYIAGPSCVIYTFPVVEFEGLKNMLSGSNKDYKGLVVTSLTKIYGEIMKINERYLYLAGKLYPELSEGYDKYVKACKNGGMPIEELTGIDDLNPYKDVDPIPQEERDYYLEMSMIPGNVVKAYFGDSLEMVMRTVKETSAALLKMLDNTLNAGAYINDFYSVLYNDGDNNLLSRSVHLYKELERSGRADKSLLTLCEELRDFYLKAERTVVDCMGGARPVNKDRLRQVMESLSGGEEVGADAGADEAVADEDLYRSLKNSLRTILAFGNISEGDAKDFENHINAFADLKDRLSSEDKERKLRHKLADGFYKIYREVFVASLNAPRLPKPVELFLNFGYTDERLLTKEQAIELCKLKIQTKQNYFCHMFTIPEWLRAIYDGKREPSKNEFDLEYNEYLRERLKNREIDEKQMKTLQDDREKKLDFEIFNMFKYTERIVNGSLSTFVPVLCSEQISGSLTKAVLTKDRMGQMVQRYRELDYSAFHRELLFADKNLNIEKETIMLEVGPDIILFPCFGGNAIMWQEISCKHRDSSGRFLFPILVEGNPDDLYIRNLARFRWELCRTMQGSAWNNIQFKSLTSEYSDYIQYYRKNRDLTEDKKEKIKTQIVKGKNNVREVFVQDYEQWIKFESQGGMKLNKTSREILALYCPFNKEIRKNLVTQPAFSDALGRFDRETAKKAKELELRYRSLAKAKAEIPEIMQNTLKFYKEM
ncbi:MAG: hypothetical protein IJS80_01410 [Lachnospiraceae bacterium]|nr:hypothetical protein [Lachnospiraceae bacterium]